MGINEAVIRQSATKEEIGAFIDDLASDILGYPSLLYVMKHGPRVIKLFEPHEPKLAEAMQRLYIAMGDVLAFLEAWQAAKG